jgi:catechol 2,3-dioxygenase-like lactoylglutathione lyase family enzyme
LKEPAGRGSPPGAAVVRRVDHVNVATADPEALAALLARVLGLTVAWPFTDNGGYTTTGLVAGPSVTLAVDRSDGEVPFLVPTDRSRFSTVAFAPTPTEGAIIELDRRGISHGAPRVFAAWTNTLLPGLLDDPDMAFLCEYTTEAWFEEMKADLVRTFHQHGGGPAGVTGLAEVIVTTADLDAGSARWARLLGTPTHDLTWTFEESPAFVLEPGADDRVAWLVFSVRDLEAARAAMDAEGIPSKQFADAMVLDPAALDGLHIRLRAGDPSEIVTVTG